MAMTPQEHEKQAKVLQRSIQAAKATLLGFNGNLQQKLVLKQKVKEAEEALRNHKLFFYDLTRSDEGEGIKSGSSQVASGGA